MVGTLVRLQVKLRNRQLKSNIVAMIFTIIYSVFGLLLILAAAVGMFFLRDADLTLRAALTVGALTIVTICWPIFSAFVSGTNEMIDIGRFALFPVRARDLIPGLFFAGLTGFGGIMTLVLAIGFIGAWSGSALTALAAIIGAGLGIILCLVTSRVLASVLSRILRRRRARDVMVIIIFLVIFGGSLAINLGSQITANTGIDVQALIAAGEQVARVLSWTPFGWPWAIPWSVASGQWLLAAGQLVGTIIIAAVLIWVWGWFVGKNLVSPLDDSVSGEEVKATSFTDRFFPYSPAGAIAKRDIKYFRRDPRRMIGNIAMLVIPIIMMVSMLAGSQGASGDELHVIKIISTYAAVMFSWMAGVFAAGDICYDGSALGTQILTGASGRDDRLGRSMAILFLTVPVQLVFIVGFTLYTGMWEQLPGVIGIAACMLLGGCGVGVLVSSFWQYSQPPAGGNMFGKGSTGGVAGFIVAMLSLFVPIIACAPSIILSVVANVTGHLVIFGLISMVVGIGIGACILWFGISIGGKQLDNSWPEVLDRVTWKN